MLKILQKWASFVSCAILFLATFLLYQSSLDYPFVFDAKALAIPGFIQNNLTPFSPFTLRWFTNLSFWLLQTPDYAPFAQNLFNIILHATNGCLLFGVFTQLYPKKAQAHYPWVALIACLFFVLHPISVYAVSYTIQRSILWCVFFSLLSLITVEKLGLSLKSWFLCALCYFLALYSKEHVILLPAVLGAFCFLNTNYRIGLLIKFFIPLFLISIPVLLLQSGIIGSVYESFGQLALDTPTSSEQQYQLTQNPWLLSVISQGSLFFRYLQLWMMPLPQNLSIDIHLPKITHWLAWPQTLTFIGFLTHPLIVFYTFKKTSKPLIAFALIAPWIWFLPELSTVRFSEQFVLYRSYLWVPFSLLLFFPLSKALKTKNFFCLMIPIICGLSLISLNRIQTFQSPVTLWEDAAQKINPKDKRILTSYRPFNSLGSVLIDAQKPQEALTPIQKALEIKPNYHVAWHNLAVAQEKLGDLRTAAQNYQKALSLDPHSTLSLNHYGTLLLRQKKYAEAQTHLEKATRIDPNYQEAWNHLGLCYFHQKLFKKAALAYQKGLQISNHHKGLHNNLGLLFFKTNNPQKAEQHFKEALRLAPKFQEAQINLSSLVYQQAVHQIQKNNINQAETLFRQALKLNPQDVKSFFNLAMIYKKQKKINQAKDLLNQALSLSPKNSQILKALAEINTSH